MNPSVAAALAAAGQALDRVEAIEDPYERIRLLKPLAAGIHEFYVQAVEIRKAEVIRLYLEENLPLAELGRRTGMSKARVHQIVRHLPAKRPVAGRPTVVPVPVLAEMEIGSADLATAHYRLYDAAGVLLYTGIADNLKARFDDHRTGKPWWPEVARRTVTWYGTRQDALCAEDIAIKTERPVHNIAGTVREAEAG